MDFKSRKGSEFVEASVVMPIVILAVLAVLWIVINLYSATSAQAAGHMLLRDYAGKDSGTQTLLDISSPFKNADSISQSGYAAAQVAIDSHLSVEGAVGSGAVKELMKAGLYGKASYDFDRSYSIGKTYDATATHSASVYLIKQSTGIRRLDLLR